MTAADASPRTWAMWGVGVSVYFMAVFNRSSLGVAGLLANQRFHIGAGQLAVFTMLQLLVYAGMQVPVGLLVDRFGSRTVLTAGIGLMSVAQLGFAVATTYPEALAARIVVGMGDAMTFICVLRLVSAWFPVRRIPLMTQLTGNVGYLGGITAAVPLSWALGRLGWTTAYLIAAGAGLVILIVLRLSLRDAPEARHLRGRTLRLPELRTSLAASWRQPGTRLGFWIHFATPFSANTLSLLWGFPFLVKGEGLGHGTAATILTVVTVGAMIGGPTLGWLAGHQPWHRSSMGLTVVAATATMWTVVLAWPGSAPGGLLVLLALVVGLGSPGSMLGFDVGRTSNPAERMASASGIINQGGFIASLISILAVGWILDWRAPGSSAYTIGAFRWAFGFQYVLWGLGVVQILRYRRRVRSRVDRPTVESGSSMVQESREARVET